MYWLHVIDFIWTCIDLQRRIYRMYFLSKCDHILRSFLPNWGLLKHWLYDCYTLEACSHCGLMWWCYDGYVGNYHIERIEDAWAGRENGAKIDYQGTRRYIHHIYLHIDGLVQEIHNSIANTLKLRLSCTNPLIYSGTSLWHGRVFLHEVKFCMAVVSAGYRSEYKPTKDTP